MSEDGAGPRVEVTDRSGTRTEIAARAVVLAPGARGSSLVADRVSFTDYGQTPHRIAIYEGDQYGKVGNFERAIGGHKVLTSLWSGGGKTAFVVRLPPGLRELPAGTERDVAEHAVFHEAATASGIGTRTPLTEARVDDGARVMNQTLIGSRVIPLGDLALKTSLWTGMGVNIGFYQAARAGDMLAVALRESDGSPAQQHAFERYKTDSLRDRDAFLRDLHLQPPARALAELPASRGRVALRGLSSPGAKKQVDRHTNFRVATTRAAAR